MTSTCVVKVAFRLKNPVSVVIFVVLILEIIRSCASAPVLHDRADGFFQFSNRRLFDEKTLDRLAIGFDDGFLIQSSGEEQIRNALVAEA